MCVCAEGFPVALWFHKVTVVQTSCHHVSLLDASSGMLLTTPPKMSPSPITVNIFKIKPLFEKHTIIKKKGTFHI